LLPRTISAMAQRSEAGIGVPPRAAGTSVRQNSESR
jgi:hypothetical protein